MPKPKLTIVKDGRRIVWRHKIKTATEFSKWLGLGYTTDVAKLRDQKAFSTDVLRMFDNHPHLSELHCKIENSIFEFKVSTDGS